jgi:F-type H+-transporting ATPase subunit b
MKKILALISLSAALFANEAASHGTDIVPRTINFLIFAAILWYLIGDKVKKFFQERRESIARKFQEIEEKLKESKARKEALKAQVSEAKHMAQEIIETAKKEAELIEKKIKEQLEEEIALLQKHFEEFKTNEIKKTKQEAIKEYLNEIFDEIHISSEDAAKLVLKVA